eukprot:scaffold3687_cov240-Pinguiococcus_pyrenoidosus.AAC.12
MILPWPVRFGFFACFRLASLAPGPLHRECAGGGLSLSRSALGLWSCASGRLLGEAHGDSTESA